MKEVRTKIEIDINTSKTKTFFVDKTEKHTKPLLNLISSM